MKKNIYFIITAIIVAVGLFVSCYENVIDETSSQIDYDPESPFRAAMINTDAASKEVLKVVTAGMDTLVYYGNKHQDGTTVNLYTVEYNSHDGTNTVIELAEDGNIACIYNDSGTSVSFEWISESAAVVNAHSQEYNYLISTVIDFTKLGEEIGESSMTKSTSNIVREGDLRLEIIKNTRTWINPKNIVATRLQYDPDNYSFESQEVWLWIYQCSSSYNAKNYLLVKNATTGAIIGKLMNPKYIAKGNYVYSLPFSSYPTSATNQDMCNQIDAAIRNFEDGLGKVLLVSDELVIALNSVAMSMAPITQGTSLGIAAIADLIIGGANIFDCILQLAEHAGGISALMKWANSEWYYKEYIISEVTLTPVGFTQSKTVMGEPKTVSPNDDDIFVTLDMQGNPVINSFVLNPSHPGEGESYTATVDYHCIPENSTVTISIVGTDGYEDSITENISDSGSAVLYVPGAESGVFDVCTVEIRMPFGETLTMQASLVFGI